MSRNKKNVKQFDVNVNFKIEVSFDNLDNSENPTPHIRITDSKTEISPVAIEYENESNQDQRLPLILSHTMVTFGILTLGTKQNIINLTEGRNEIEVKYYPCDGKEPITERGYSASTVKNRINGLTSLFRHADLKEDQKIWLEYHVEGNKQTLYIYPEQGKDGTPISG